MNFDDLNFEKQMFNNLQEQQKLAATYSVADSIDKLNKRINVENEKTLKEIQSNSKTQKIQFIITSIISGFAFLTSLATFIVTLAK